MNLAQPDPDISLAFMIALDAAGRSEAEGDAKILRETNIDQTGLQMVHKARHALTALAIDQIHRSFRGNPTITREEASANIRNAAFYLTDEAFEQLFKYANWCIAKGC